MLRTLAPLALILLVLFGTWLIWPRAEFPARVEAPALESRPTARTLLRVLCVARKDGRAIPGVKLHVQPDATAEERCTDAEGRAEFAVAPGGELYVTAEGLERDVSQEGVEVPALAAGETREILFRFDPPR